MQGYDNTVFKQWASRPADQRFASLDDLKAKVHSRAMRSRTIDDRIDRFCARLNNDGEVVLEHPNIAGRELVPTHYAFGQFCQRIGAPAGFLRELDDPDLVTRVLNNRIGQAGDVEVKLLYNDTDLETDTLVSEYRAATSTKYGRIWDYEVVQLVDRILDMTGGEFYSPFEWGKKSRALYASDSDVFMFFVNGGSLVDGGGERDQLFRGFYIGNSEVGKRTFFLKMFYFQVVCGNFQIWGQQDVQEISIRHTRFAPDRYAGEAMPAIRSYMESSTAGEVETIRKLKLLELPADDKLRLKWGMDHGFTRGETLDAISIAESEIGECKNVWQFMDGLTMSARTIPFADAKEDLEKRSGALVRLVQ